MIGDRIAELRMQYGWSQSQLARSLHLCPKTVKNWEAGVSDPSAKSLKQLAGLFSVTSDYLLDIENDLTFSFKDLPAESREQLSAIIQTYLRFSKK